MIGFILYPSILGHVQTASNFFAGGSEVSAYSLDGKQQKQQSSKIDSPLVIDVNKKKRVGKREVNLSTLSNSV